jgi:hypothetical protein
MGRKHSCKICTSDLAITSQVNAQIEAGCKQKLIHEQNPQFSISQISRHTRNCLAPKPTSDLSTEQGSAEIAKWLERADQTFLVASANGDVRSAASAIGTAVRTLSAMHRKQEREAEKAEKAVHDPTDVQFTVAQIDALVRHDAENGVGDRGYPKVYTLHNEEQQFRQLVQAIWDNRALLPLLLAAATANYIPERKSENVQPNN